MTILNAFLNLQRIVKIREKTYICFVGGAKTIYHFRFFLFFVSVCISNFIKNITNVSIFRKSDEIRIDITLFASERKKNTYERQSFLNIKTFEDLHHYALYYF